MTGAFVCVSFDVCAFVNAYARCECAYLWGGDVCACVVMWTVGKVHTSGVYVY